MSIVTLSEAKLHLRVDGTDEDTLIQALLNAAEKSAALWMGRNLYADQNALTAAKTAAPSLLTTATSAYTAATTAAEAISDDIESAITQEAADDAYASAQETSKLTQYGIVIDDMIRAAVLLTVGAFYESREAGDIPQGARSLLQPYKAYR